MDLKTVTQPTLDAMKENAKIRSRVSIDFTGTNTFEILPYELVESLTITESLKGSEGASTTNSASIVFYNRDRNFSARRFETYNPGSGLYNGIQQSDGLGNLRPDRKVFIEAQLVGSSEWVPMFTGYVDEGGFKETLKGINSKVVISLKDLMKRMLTTDAELDISGDKVKPTYVGLDAVDIGDENNSIFHQLLDIMPGAYSTDVEDLDYQVPYAPVSGTVGKELASLADAYLALFTVLEDETIYFGDSLFNAQDLSAKITFDNSVFSVLKRGDNYKNIKNYVEANWSEAEKLDKRKLWEFSEGATELGVYLYSIPNGDIVLNITNPDVKYMCEYIVPIQYQTVKDNETIVEQQQAEVLYAENIDIQSVVQGNMLSADLTIVAYDITTYPNKAKLRIANSSGSLKFISKLYIEGEPIVYTKEHEATAISQESIDNYGKKKKTYSNKFWSPDLVVMPNIPGAPSMAQFNSWVIILRDNYKIPMQTAEFSTTIPLIHTRVGVYADVKEELSDSEIDAKMRIIKISRKFKGSGCTHSFTLDGFAANGVSEATEDLLAKFLRTPIPREAMDAATITPITANGNLLLDVNVIEGFDTGGGTTVPAIPTLSSVNASAACIIIPDVQENLTNFEYMEWQVSNDDATWYSLEFDGSDWKDVLDGTTKQYNQAQMIHNNIPLLGTVDTPLLRTLYYRCRRVTKTPVASSYSSSITCDAEPLGSQVIAAQTLYANQIKTTEIDTLLLQVSVAAYIGYKGTGSLTSPDEGDTVTYVDEDEIIVGLEYTGGVWSSVKGIKIGGAVLGIFFAFITACGLIHPLADNTDLIELMPANSSVYSFDVDYSDQNGNALATQNVQISTSSGGKFGECLETDGATVGNGYVRHSGEWVAGDSVIIIFWCYPTLSRASNDNFISISATGNNDQIQLANNNNDLLIRVKKNGSTILSVVDTGLNLTDNTWQLIGLYYDADTDTVTVLKNLETPYDSGVLGGSWGSASATYASIEFHVVLGGVPEMDMKIDDLFISFGDLLDIDIAIQHYTHNIPWNGNFSARDAIIRPQGGGNIVLDGSVKALGVGIDNPLANIDVLDSDPTILLRNTAVNQVNSGSIKFQEVNGGAYFILSHNGSANTMNLYSSNLAADVLVISRVTGNIGIGTTPSETAIIISGKLGIRNTKAVTNGTTIAPAIGRTMYQVNISNNYSTGNSVRCATYMVLTNNEGTAITNSTRSYVYNGQTATFAISAGYLTISGLSSGNNKVSVILN